MICLLFCGCWSRARPRPTLEVISPPTPSHHSPTSPPFPPPDQLNVMDQYSNKLTARSNGISNGSTTVANDEGGSFTNDVASLVADDANTSFKSSTMPSTMPSTPQSNFFQQDNQQCDDWKHTPFASGPFPATWVEERNRIFPSGNDPETGRPLTSCQSLKKVCTESCCENTPGAESGDCGCSMLSTMVCSCVPCAGRLGNMVVLSSSPAPPYTIVSTTSSETGEGEKEDLEVGLDLPPVPKLNIILGP